MSQSLSELLEVVLPSFIGGGLVLFLAKNWFLERLRGGIKSEYDRELERLKADLSAKNSKEIEDFKASLSKNASIVSAVQKSFSDSHYAYQAHRINAIKELWESLLYVQHNSPPIFTFLDALLPNEYGETLGTKQMKTFSDIANNDIEKMFNGKANGAQNHRLLTGDYLWSLFLAYQALSARIAFLFISGRDKQNVTPWYTDKGCISIIKSVCTSSEFDEFEEQQFGKIAWIRSLIESKFLLVSNRILSGQASSDIALEEAKRIEEAISTANRKTS